MPPQGGDQAFLLYHSNLTVNSAAGEKGRPRAAGFGLLAGVDLKGNGVGVSHRLGTVQGEKEVDICLLCMHPCMHEKGHAG